MNQLKELQRLEKVLDYFYDGIQLIDAESRLVYCNQASSEIDNIVIKDSIGKSIVHIYPSLKETDSTILEVLKTGKPVYNREQTYRNYRGKTVATINTTLPLYNEKQLVGAVEISRNLTEFLALNEKVIHLQSKVEKHRSAEILKRYAIDEKSYVFDDIITNNVAFKRVVKTAKKAALTNIPILIYGDTGTGKELVTQAIHNASERSDENFIAQNCAALPNSLLEGILFGTVKGGFTGAVDRPGLFELANHGTLFLDEINSMPIELQAKILRVLQNGKVRRVGASSEKSVNVRVIAATNIEPNVAIERGLIRRDLYYRINTVTLWIPKLADRREDIPVLTHHFIRKYNQQFYKSVKGITREVEDLFMAYPWDGNVRELEHVIEGAVSLSDSERIDIEDVPYNLRQFAGEHIHRADISSYPVIEKGICVEGCDFSAKVKDFEVELILRALSATQGNVTQAAKFLNLPRQTLQSKMAKYNI